MHTSAHEPQLPTATTRIPRPPPSSSPSQVRKELADQTFIVANAESNAEQAQSMRNAAMQLKQELDSVQSAAKQEIRRLSLELARWAGWPGVGGSVIY